MPSYIGDHDYDTTTHRYTVKIRPAPPGCITVFAPQWMITNCDDAMDAARVYCDTEAICEDTDEVVYELREAQGA